MTPEAREALERALERGRQALLESNGNVLTKDELELLVEAAERALADDGMESVRLLNRRINEVTELRQRLAEVEDENTELREWRDHAVASCAKRRCSERDSDLDALRCERDALTTAVGEWAQVRAERDALKVECARLRAGMGSLLEPAPGEGKT